MAASRDTSRHGLSPRRVQETGSPHCSYQVRMIYWARRRPGTCTAPIDQYVTCCGEFCDGERQATQWRKSRRFGDIYSDSQY